MSAPVYVPRHSKRPPRLPLPSLPSYGRAVRRWLYADAALILVAVVYAWTVTHG